MLRTVISGAESVLEVACGTGEHAEYMTQAFPKLRWLATDLPGYLASAKAWQCWASRKNFRDPMALDVTDVWPDEQFDMIYSANMVHYVPWSVVKAFFLGARKVLRPNGILFLYGPYRYQNRPLEPSNIAFDSLLKAREPEAGIRLFAEVDALAKKQGLELVRDVAMPANNRAIFWRRA